MMRKYILLLFVVTAVMALNLSTSPREVPKTVVAQTPTPFPTPSPTITPTPYPTTSTLPPTTSIRPTTSTTSSSTTTSIQPTTSTTSSSTTTSIRPTTSTTSSSTTTLKKCPCLIEKIYGEDSKETELLRYFKDNLLSKTPGGRELIKMYYQWSPILVKVIEEDEEFKAEVKEMIDGVLELIGKEVE